MSHSQHTRDLRTFSRREIVVRDRPSEKWFHSGLQFWLSETRGICVSFSTTNFECIFSRSSFGASSVAPFRSSNLGNGNVACLAVWFNVRENVLLGMLAFRSSFVFPKPATRAVFSAFEFGSGNAAQLPDNPSQGERCMKDTVHPVAHPSVHPLIFGGVDAETVTYRRTVNLDADKTPDWAGATHFCARVRAQSNSWSRSSPTAR